MSFAGRTRNEIRDTLLGYWQAEYAAATPPQTLLVAPGSDAYLLASALAAILEALEAQAEANARNLMPDTADKAALDRFGAVYDLPRLPGKRTTATVTVTSPTTSSGIKGIPAGTRMTASDGTLYNVDDTIATFSSYTATIRVSAVNPGAPGSSLSGATLTFVATPTDFNSTGTVATVVPGTSEEEDGPYSLRIIQFLRERPASGNRADWRAWVEDYSGTEIAAAYVYPLLRPAVPEPGAGVELSLGCVTVVAIGPAQGDSPVNTRIVPEDDVATRTEGVSLNRIREYIDGSRDATGALVSNGVQLRPVTMAVGNYTVQSAEVTLSNVVVQAVMSTPYAFPWTGTMTVHGTSTTTSLVVTGDETAKDNTSVLVRVLTSAVRGGYALVSLGTGSYNGGTNRTTWTVSAIADTPLAGQAVYPAPPNWSELRAAAFAFFDSLGPGDTVTPVRWPGEDVTGRATFYRSVLAARLLSVAGTLSATVTSPGSDVVPPAKHIVNVGTFLVTA